MIEYVKIDDGEYEVLFDGSSGGRGFVLGGRGWTTDGKFGSPTRVEAVERLVRKMRSGSR